MPMPQDRAMRPTTNDIEAANAELLAMGFFPIRGGDGTDDPAPNPDDPAPGDQKPDDDEGESEEEKKAGLSEAAKAILKKNRDAAKLARQEAAAAKAERDRLLAEKAATDEAKRLADEAEAVKKGKFESIAEQRGEALKAKDADLTAANAKIASLVTALKPEVEDAWKALPDEITELYAGAADDVLGKREFMASHKKLIDKLAGKTEDDKQRLRVPRVPVPNLKHGDIETDIEKKAVEANARRYQ